MPVKGKHSIFFVKRPASPVADRRRAGAGIDQVVQVGAGRTGRDGDGMGIRHKRAPFC